MTFGRPAWKVLVISAFCALTAIVLWPLPLDAARRLPHDLGDPLLSTWILWWNSQAVPLTRSWWDVPSFHPITGSFALSEHMLGLAWLSVPVQLLTDNPVLAYNVTLLASFPLAAYCTLLLVRELTNRVDVAFAAALIFGFNPYRIAVLPHIHVLSAYWMPLGLFALHRYLNSSSRRWLAVFALSWLVQALANGYFLFFYSVLILLWIAWFVPWRTRPGAAVAILTAWACAGLVITPFLLEYRDVHQTFGLSRGIDEIEAYSADVTAYLNASHLHRWWPAWRYVAPEQALFPGVTGVALFAVSAGWVIQMVRRDWPLPRLVWGSLSLSLVFAIVGLSARVTGPWRLDAGPLSVSVSHPYKPFSMAFLCLLVALAGLPFIRRAARSHSVPVFYGLSTLLMFLLSCGPTVHVDGHRVLYKAPYAWLMTLPGFDGLRVPARFAMLGVLGLAITAGLVLHRVTSGLSSTARRAVIACVVVAAVADVWTLPIPLHAPPDQLPQAGLRQGSVVFEIPFAAPDLDAAALYRSIRHERPTVNGYGGYWPPHYAILHAAIGEDDVSVLTPLARSGNLDVVLTRRDDDLRSQLAALAVAAPASGGSSPFDILHLSSEPHRPAAPAQAVSCVDVASLARDGAALDLSAVVDGDVRSAWSTASPQTGTEDLVVTLREPTVIDTVVLLPGLHPAEYPRDLQISIAAGAEWMPVWRGRGAPLALEGALSAPRTVPIRVTFPRVSAARLRLQQLGSSVRSWAIAELRVGASIDGDGRTSPFSLARPGC